MATEVQVPIIYAGVHGLVNPFLLSHWLLHLIKYA